MKQKQDNKRHKETRYKLSKKRGERNEQKQVKNCGCGDDTKTLKEADHGQLAVVRYAGGSGTVDNYL